MRKLLLALAILACGFAGSAAQDNPDVRLETIFEDYHQYILERYPEQATYEGDKRYNDKLTDMSAAAYKAHYDTLKTFVARAKEVPSDSVSETNQLNQMLFVESLEETIAQEKFKDYVMPLNQQHGLHIDFPQLVGVQPLKTKDDYKLYITRLYGFSKQVDDVIENMREGIKLKLVQPKFVMEQVLSQIENIKNKPVDQMPFVSRLKVNTSLSDKDKTRLAVNLIQAVNSSVKPAYQKLHDFIKKEYLPKARTSEGVWSLADGKERYQAALKTYATTNISPDSLFNLGMREVERISGQMRALKDEIGFSDSLEVFHEYLRANPKFYFTSKDSLIASYTKVIDMMKKEMRGLFGVLPKAGLEVKEMEEWRAPYGPSASYYAAPEDRSRPAYFYVNTYDLTARPKFYITALALHEGIPGHHMQMALSQETEKLPWFRRNMNATAFTEGWALYAESLGEETGLYHDLYQRYGALDFEMWRAARLVVDAGIHAKKWTREQAVQFLLKHSPNSERDIRAEVDRYIAWPGQATAYKIGQMKIKELRESAQRLLGFNFSLTGFHDAVLAHGAIPLPHLERNIGNWVGRNR